MAPIDGSTVLSGCFKGVRVISQPQSTRKPEHPED
jgi:hypothetical protein